MGVTQSYTGLLAVRAVLGFVEGGLLPGMVRDFSPSRCSRDILLIVSPPQVLYLSMLYRRDEMGLRMGLVYSSASLSGAFGGLLATGLNRLNGVGGYQGWRWIFIIEVLVRYRSVIPRQSLTDARLTDDFGRRSRSVLFDVLLRRGCILPHA